MSAYSEFNPAAALPAPLSNPEKAAAILLAMGRPIAGKLLKFFEQDELQAIISRAQSLRSVPQTELAELVAEFEDLFSEGAGLMDNAKAMEGILEEGLTPDEVDGLLGRTASSFTISEETIWESIQDFDPAQIGKFMATENPQTVAYVISKLPSAFASKVLIALPEDMRAEIIHRTLNIKSVNSRAARIIESRLAEMLTMLEAERNTAGTDMVVGMMNEMEKDHVEQLLVSLEAINQKDAEKVRPKVFLFEDILGMQPKHRVKLFDGISGDVITTALNNSNMDIREAVLSSLGARQRRMIEADLSNDDFTANPRDVAVARRTITQEAIRLSVAGQIQLKDETAQRSAAA